MTTEERNVPELPQLLNEVAEMQGRLDKSVQDGAANAVQFLQHDLLPWLKDFLESTMLSLDDIEDSVAPIQLPRSSAQNLVEILLATKQSNSTNEVLVARIDEALEDLEYGEDEDADEGDEA
jgi:hypothetical protein